MTKTKINFLKNNIIIFFLIISLLHGLKFFEGIFIILNNNYPDRMVKYSGFCENEGYGFIKDVYQNFKKVKNINVINYNNAPPVQGYFYDTAQSYDKNSIILIGASQIVINDYIKENFLVIKKIDNCYYLEK